MLGLGLEKKETASFGKCKQSGESSIECSRKRPLPPFTLDVSFNDTERKERNITVAEQYDTDLMSNVNRRHYSPSRKTDQNKNNNESNDNFISALVRRINVLDCGEAIVKDVIIVANNSNLVGEEVRNEVVTTEAEIEEDKSGRNKKNKIIKDLNLVANKNQKQ